MVRADSDFYTEEILSYLKQQNLNYIIKMRIDSNVKSEVSGLEDWISICPGIEVNQMYFKHEGGKIRIYIVDRKEIKNRPKAGEKSLVEDFTVY